ncbi:hypothetical protein SAMN05443665_101288 [Actinomadura meyerae]|uniref:PT repeat-containing protein n=1 Tax=Actinomadura meyerae TaxID=240840 RepID=A0A239IEA0_9ACTN|nr:hypothetical protein [Actinomadura meyerae]SNS91859.1 hypothetical protein SAMN05443665_101288 [Actinomadura meyerae]
MKRGLVAVLVLGLALSGCGGSGDGGGDAGASAPPAPAASAPASAPSGAASAPAGTTVTPVPPGVSKATQAFNDCMHKQGVELPTPNPTSTPAKKDLEKIKAALRTCVKSMSASPPPAE